MKRKNILKYMLIIIMAISIAWIPSGYYCMFPGEAKSLGDVVSGGLYEPETAFHMTTVLMTKANYPVYFYGKLNPNVRVLPAESVLPIGWDNDEYLHYSQFQMAESHNNAKLAVARILDIDYVEVMGEITVLRTVPDTPAYGVLKANDIILAIDDEKLSSVADAVTKLRSYQPGDEVKIEFKRDDDVQTVQVIMAVHPSVEGRGFLGVSLINDHHSVDFMDDYAIDIETGNITGPSAGLMLTLEVLNSLIEEDLTGGQQIGGTGTIAADGTVGNIGGINQKIITAHRADIEVFFLPVGNVEEIELAESKYEGMTLVPVATVDEALAYLRTMIE